MGTSERSRKDEVVLSRPRTQAPLGWAASIFEAAGQV